VQRQLAHLCCAPKSAERPAASIASRAQPPSAIAQPCSGVRCCSSVRFSYTVTWAPAWARAGALTRPEGPPPITATLPPIDDRGLQSKPATSWHAAWEQHLRPVLLCTVGPASFRQLRQILCTDDAVAIVILCTDDAVAIVHIRCAQLSRRPVKRQITTYVGVFLLQAHKTGQIDLLLGTAASALVAGCHLDPQTTGTRQRSPYLTEIVLALGACALYHSEAATDPACSQTRNVLRPNSNGSCSTYHSLCYVYVHALSVRVRGWPIET
jgi:hypothetical protein